MATQWSFLLDIEDDFLNASLSSKETLDLGEAPRVSGKVEQEDLVILARICRARTWVWDMSRFLPAGLELL